LGIEQKGENSTNESDVRFNEYLLHENEERINNLEQAFEKKVQENNNLKREKEIADEELQRLKISNEHIVDKNLNLENRYAYI